MRARPGMRAWIHYTNPSGVIAGWPARLEVIIMPQGDLDIRYQKVRDATGRERVFPHFDIEKPFEYQKGGRGAWVPESDPRVLDRLEIQLRKHLELRATVPTSHAVFMDAWQSRHDHLRFILLRNGRVNHTPPAS